jgi:hypothetical protein
MSISEVPRLHLACAFCRRPAFTVALGFALCENGPEVGGANCMDRAREMFRKNVHEAIQVSGRSPG